ncbi:cell division septal protein [secondary endosymbiont of Heteropsylla cubana]|uniref:Cell division septal protein n=1 Tax=secondary endosymbiont of Heteropsylla cubana TaxID=134287 RepID=J3YTB5_9ENTR|nr:FtsQ-type POTRA domain-containing protein [secondary endosymbiont of Heteropsylla cubana]AFP85688.1 cell division septal protein [secondary endosymbiont of Heteropsylla cubana]
MSQEVINTYQNSNIENNTPSNTSHVIGIVLLIILTINIIIKGWVCLEWMKNDDHLGLPKLIITEESFYTTKNDIHQAILTLGKPDNFISQNLNQIDEQIKYIPWIKQVNISKKWPNELKIHLVEYMPICRWSDKYLLD